MRTTARLLLICVISGVSTGAAAAADDTSVPPIDGAAIYRDNCQTCHGTFERSNEPFFPALAQRAANRTPEQFVATILSGRLRWAGDMGSHMSPNMPALDYLPNEDIAAIVNYLYAQAGVAETRVSTETVARARANLEGGEQDIVLSGTDYGKAERLYLELCAGCHGLDRLGLSGSALDAESLKDRSTAELMETLHYGTSWGMPNWGTSQELSAAQMSLLARYLKLGARRAPTFTLEQVRASWEQDQREVRPRRRQFAVALEDLFITLLHDTGQVALIDGARQKVQSIIDTDLAPHDVALSKNGRYLYVLSRAGRIALIDLYLKQPAVVARIRAAYSARNLALSMGRGRPILVAGGHGAPTVTAFDAQTLEPLGQAALDTEHPWGPDASILDIDAVPGSNRFAIIAHSLPGLIELTATGRGKRFSLQAQSFGSATSLRVGSLDQSGRYLLAATDEEGIVVFDLKERTELTTVDLGRWWGGSSGSAFTDPEHGPVWAVSSLSEAKVALIGTDPKRHPDAAWKVVRTFELPSGGPIYTATHPQSNHLWTDLTLSGKPELASTVVAIDRRDLIGKRNTLQLRDALPERFNRVTAIHPQFDSTGSKVWFTLWNRQDLPSGIAIVDDGSMTVDAVITDARLITPIRTFSAVGLLEGR